MSIDLKGTLVLVGCGKMGGAMLEGWLKAGADPEKIVAYDPKLPDEVAELLVRNGIRHNAPVSTITDAEVIVVAVKPQVMDEVLPPLVPLKRSKPVVLSIAAGKTIASFARHFGEETAIIRAMPNTPAAIGRGITALVPNAYVTKPQLALAHALLGATGEVVDVEDENQIDLVTAVSGSGPAYVFWLTECLANAGVKAGLSEELATRLARATVSGSGELMRQSGIDAETLRKNVTSPGGTTFAALQVLMAEDGMKPLLEKAIAAAAHRAKELAS